VNGWPGRGEKQPAGEMHTMKIVGTAALLLSFLCGGCETIGTSAANNDTAIGKIKIGISQRPDVTRLLGVPSVVYSSLMIQGRSVDVWAYRYSHHQKDPLSLVPILNFYSTQERSKESTVNVFFGSLGVVTDVQVTRRKS
jgi:outer membrane protein assembly factor BamE (lipoprotein component of BamABCDE complex)